MDYLKKRRLVRRRLMVKTGEKIKGNASNRDWADYFMRHGITHGMEVNSKRGYKRFVHEVVEAEYEAILEQRAQDAAESYVYIAGSLEMGFVKIGKAKDPSSRIDSLQVGCPHELKVFAVFKERGLEFEKKLHERAKPYHHRGEWFRIAGRLQAFIRAQKPLTRDELRLRLEAGAC